MRGDIDAVLDGFAEDATFTNPEYAVEGGVREGREAVRASLQALHEGFAYAGVAIEDLVEGPSGLLVVARMDASGRESGARMEVRFFHVFRLRGDEVVDFAWFRSLEEGRRAIGLD